MHELIYLTNEILDLFFAGYIFIMIFNWLTGIKMEIYLIGIWSLVTNKFIKTIFLAIHSILFVKVDFDENIKVIVYVIFAIISAFLLAKLYNSNKIRKLLSIVCLKTFGNNAFKDLIDFNKRTMMLVYPKDSEWFYGGAFKLMDENGSDSYIALIEYCIYNKEDGQLLRDHSQHKMSITFRMQDIEHIELLYEEDSEVWNRLVYYSGKVSADARVRKSKRKRIVLHKKRATKKS